MDTPTLRGKRVTLEPLVPSTAEELAAAIAPGDDVYRWTSSAPRTLDEMRAWIEARRTPRLGLANLAFAQRDAATGRLAGSTSLFDLDVKAQSAEIGHTWLAAPYRRSGVNTESKLLLLTHGFETLKLERIQLCTDILNERSQRAIERIGATREGVLRNYRRRLDGSLRDTVLYAFVAQEWPQRKARLEAMLR